MNLFFRFSRGVDVLAMVLGLALGLFSSDSWGAEVRIDLQWAICQANVESLVSHLGGEGPAKQSQVTYFETESIDYLRRGISFNLKSKKDSIETSVKVRFSSARDFDGDCEWDRYGQKERYSCDFSEKDRSADSPWSKKQIAFAEKVEKIDWKRLKAFGPYPSKAWKGELAGYRVSLDRVDAGSGVSPLIELSAKVDYSERERAYSEISAELVAQKVKLCEHQESKAFRLFRALGLWVD
ncbi:MAG: hypothetical protein RJB38_1996 [Pseudomonadota bacterium]|jgi:hypothetical protein